MTPAQKYEIDFQEFRRSRPEWKAMLEAIRKDRSLTEINALAIAAGAGTNEVCELRSLRARAVQGEPAAKSFPAEQKKRAALVKEVDRAVAAAESATADGYADALVAVRQASEKRDRHFFGEYTSAEAADRTRRIALELGVI